MEDQVPFKVYTFWEENEKPEVRRFGVEKSVVTSYHYLNAKLQDVYPLLKSKTYTVAWRDDEGDDVVISSDEEMVTALTSLGGGLIRLFVTCKKTSFKEDECEFIFSAKTGGIPMDSTPSSPAAGDNKPQAKKKKADEPVHSGVMCDVCDWPVVGFRYKCVVCPDYDLCANCEASGNHREHCMMRLPTPDISRTIIKAALKRSRNFFKTFATNLDDCPYKKHKGDKNAEKKQHAEEANARRNEYRRSERRPRHGCSWMETFANYMNEFANLAGDIDFDFETKFSHSGDKKDGNEPQEQKEQPKQEQPKTEEPKQEPPKEQPKQEQPKQEQPKQEQPKQEPSKQEQPKEQPKPEPPKQEQPEQQAAGSTQAPQQPQAGGSGKPKLKNKMPELQKLLEMYVNDYYNGYLPPQKFYATSKAGGPFTATTSHEIHMERVDPKNGDPFDFNLSPDSPTDRDMSPDKADDWTMINNEKDLLAAFGPITGPTETAIPLGFNLPEEFQERVKINDGSNLYPPLNTATAVLNPKEPEIPKVPQQTVPQGQAQAQATAPAQAKPQAAATQPQATATQPQATVFQSPSSAFQPKATAPQPTTAEAKIPAQPKQPQYYHSKPHIDAAIRCMLGMGFTNEGGWLTQLLESKDGNIAAVIDMLNPAAPKK